jgi:NAD(P)-dependent dehydrogenase (short-subunit alcohol dehydrogenase family)
MSAPSFRLEGRVAVVTGGYGVLGGCLATGLAAAGAHVAILGRRAQRAKEKVDEISALGGTALPLVADVRAETELVAARDEILRTWGRIDILVNGAGGNVPRARNDNTSIFDVPIDAHEEVLRLNLHGTVIPSLVFAVPMAEQQAGSIINISSMAAQRVLSGVLSYSMAKTAIESFTRWMAVELARKYGGGVRMNAVAPGFFVTEQNQAVLLKPDGSYTDRARRVLEHTPMGRFGRPEELVGAVQWLCSDAASFVTGVVIPVDGGFSVFSGV